MGEEGLWEFSVLYAQFCCELKTALKIQPILKRKKKFYCQQGYIFVIGV